MKTNYKRNIFAAVLLAALAFTTTGHALQLYVPI